MTIDVIRLFVRCQPLRAFIGRLPYGDWEYVLLHDDDRRTPR